MKQRIKTYIAGRMKSIQKIKDAREKEVRMMEANNIAAEFGIKIKNND